MEIKITEVLDLLENGKSREEIAEHFGISKSDVKRLFKHPKLKGKKAKKQAQFTLIDDTVEENIVSETEIVDNQEEVVNERDGDSPVEEEMQEEQPVWEN